MKRSRGFLLMEVMVTIVVITAGLLFVMRVYSTARTALNRSAEFFKYGLLMEEKMFDFEERGVIEEGSDHDRFPEAKDCFWEEEAVPLELQGMALGDLCSVKLSVFCGESSPPDKYSLWTYLLKKK